MIFIAYFVSRFWAVLYVSLSPSLFVLKSLHNVYFSFSQVLKDIYDFMTLQQSIIFVEMKRNADSVARMMIESGFEVGV